MSEGERRESRDSIRGDETIRKDCHNSHCHSHQGRRVRRAHSAVSTHEAQPHRVRTKVRRSISERGAPEDGRTSGKGRNRHGSGSALDLASVHAGSRHGSRSDSVAVELGLLQAPGVTAKETHRRRVVFAVVLVSLAILITAVFLVAVTLLLSPAVDAVLRKENEEIMRLMTTPPSALQRRSENGTVEPPTG